MALPVLNIIGTGKLGSTLGRLLADSNQVRIGALFSRSAAKAQAAQQFIGQGTVITELAQTETADLWLIATSDDAIADIARQLAYLDHNWSQTTLFHCSGIHSSLALAPLADRGAATASLHPAHSFANPETSLRTFADTCCTVDGASAAVDRLTALFAPLGATLIAIAPEMKPLYHAATAVASNHLVALLDSALALLETAGMSQKNAIALLAPLATKTCANLFQQGAPQALTGPIARGDSGTVAKHLAALHNSRPDLLSAYRELAKLTLNIAATHRRQPGHQAIAELLAQPSHGSDPGLPVEYCPPSTQPAPKP